MKKLIEFSVRHPVTISMILIIPVMFGLFSVFQMPVDMLPDINIPQLIVSTSYSGTGPEEMEKLISKPLEETFSKMKDLKKITSTSMEGVSNIMIEYEYGKNMDIAAMDIREQIDKVKNILPQGADKPIIQRFDPTSWPIIWFNIYGSQSPSELRKTAEDVIKTSLERIPGVASVEITGGKEREIKVSVEAKKLLAYNISLDEIVSSIKRENLNLRAGRIDQEKTEFLIRTLGEFNSPAELKKLIVANRNKTPIYLSDIADVIDDFKEQRSYSRINKRDSVGLLVFKESSGNTAKISDEITKRLDELKKVLPAGVSLDITFDQAEYIRDSLAMVKDSAVSGSVLAILILFLFLTDWRSTSIISISIPYSVLSTLALLYLNHISLNILTLAGLALGIGMVVDNSIVVLENTFRHIGMKEDPVQATIDGTAEVALPILSSTLTTVVVFLPIAFVKGITGQLFYDLSFSIVFSLLFSTIVAYTLVPMATAILYKGKKKKEHITPREEKIFKITRWTAGIISLLLCYKLMGYGPVISAIFFGISFVIFKYRYVMGFKILELYEIAMHWLLAKKRRQFSALFILFLFFILSLTFKPGMQFFPPSKQKIISGKIELPPGTSLKVTNDLARQMEEILAGYKEITTYAVNVAPQNINMTIKVDESKGRLLTEIVSDLQNKTKNFPEARAEIKRMSGQGGGHGGESDLSIKIIGDDISVVKKITEDIDSRIKKIPGLVDFNISLKENLPEVQVKLNRAKTSDLGLNTNQIANLLQTSIDGQVASTMWDKNDEIDIRVKLNDKYRENISVLKTIPLARNFTLGDVADITQATGPIKIERENQIRTASVNANLKEGMALGDIMQKISNKNKTGILDNLDLPSGYVWKYGGSSEQMMEAFKYLMIALLESLVLVYMVMAAQFESFGHPFLIMFTMPMAAIGVMLGLWISRDNLSVTAMIGIIMLAGIVVNNAILLVDFIHVSRKEGMKMLDALIYSGKTRMRPIFMTTLTTVLGMLPMALGIGAGVEFYKPLAVVTIGGLMFSTILTLFIIPVLYNLYERMHAKLKTKLTNLIRGPA
ncbi:MAG: efflux RND transporter permease subunit [bacterium]|nr:efflux RND transporter permease subunit [bacterium]